VLGWLVEPNAALPPSEYRTYIAGPRWRTRKKAYYRGHQRRCAACGTTRSIHLHHRTYDRLGCERDADLVPLCERDHDLAHAWHRRNRPRMTLAAATDEAIRVIKSRGPDRLRAMISGRYQGSQPVR
jgi:hypothetical protein